MGFRHKNLKPHAERSMTPPSECAAGEEFLLLDPHGRYLPDGLESVNTNLFDPERPEFFAAREAWPGSIAPFEAAVAACSKFVKSWLKRTASS